MRAAQLNDDRYLAEVEKLYEEQQRNQSSEPIRPPLEGFTAEVEALYDLSDDIRMLIRVLTRSELPFRLRPEMPIDRIKARKKRIGLNKIAQLLR